MEASSKSQCREGSGVLLRTNSAVRRYTACADMQIPVGDVELGLSKGTLNIIAAGVSV